jgi:CRISPR-associated protein Cas2
MTYDIVQDQQRARVHKILRGFGTWVQLSVFECWVTRKELLILREKLLREIDPRQDRLRIYALCAGCAHRVEVVGGALPSDDDLYVV